MATTYELVLMIDPQAEEARRAELAAQARELIAGGGKLVAEEQWGMRKLAYEIDHRRESDYRFFRFDGDNELLGKLNHTLRIADGVLRYRIFKVDPNAPLIVPPATGPPVVERAAAEAPAEPRAEPPAEPAEEAAEAPVEAAAEGISPPEQPGEGESASFDTESATSDTVEGA